MYYDDGSDPAYYNNLRKHIIDLVSDYSVIVTDFKVETDTMVMNSMFSSITEYIKGPRTYTIKVVDRPYEKTPVFTQPVDAEWWDGSDDDWDEDEEFEWNFI